MSDVTGPPAARPPDKDSGSFLARIGETAKTIITAVDQLKRLEREDERAQSQIRELTNLVIDLAKSNAELIGMMKSIEKRLDDKDKLVEAIITIRIRDQIEQERRKRGRKPTGNT